MRRSLLLVTLGLTLFACNGGKDTSETGSPTADADGDGFTADVDCDDQDAAINPDAEELCDGIDNNCDGSIDEDVQVTVYADSDGDGYGDAAVSQEGCAGVAGYVADNTDCDDSDADIYPGASEWCDGVDNDCDGTIDNDVVTTTWYVDNDGDGHGDRRSGVEGCEQPTGYVDVGDDCNDDEAAMFPGNTEICDLLDNDCDNEVDGPNAVDAVAWYNDGDHDGYGDPGSVLMSCEAPSGYVADDTDCNDRSADSHPGGTEVCDARDSDEDCNGLADDDDPGVDEHTMSTWYADADGDGYGDAADPGTTSCEQATGTVADNTDCDDAHSVNYPGASEYCDSLDNDCDGLVDEGTPADADTWYHDGDGDGYGDPDDSFAACSGLTGYVIDGTDCDDSDASVTDECWDTGGMGGTYDGAYTGPFSVAVTAPALGISDTCSGTITGTVAESATPQIRGSGTCSWAGLLASLVGDQTGRIDGNITTDPDVEGSIIVGTSISETWTGSFTDPYTLEGSFSGSASISGIAVTYTGQMDMAR